MFSAGAILSALSFAVVIVLMVVSLWRALAEDGRAEARRGRDLMRRMRELMGKPGGGAQDAQEEPGAARPGEAW